MRASVLGRWFVSVMLVSALAATSLSLLGATAAYATPDPIAVSMTAAPSPVASGSSLTYTVTTTNIEPQVTNVRMTDQLTGLKNVVLTSSRGYCTESALLVKCDAGSMPGQNSTWTVTITGVVTAGNGTYLDNTATVTATWSAQNSSQDYAVPATARVLVNNQPTGPSADLSTSITAPSTAAPGSPITYTLTVNNTGGANASDIFVTATVPAGFGITSVNGTSLFGCSFATPMVTCVGGAVNAGANATITINATVNATTPPPGQTLTYKATAVVDPENAIAEVDDNNNTSSHILTVPAAAAPAEPIVFTKTASSSVDHTGAEARPNDQLTYTLTVKNTGTSTAFKATRLQVTDGTQGLDAASVTAKSSDPGLVCTPSASQVKCVATNNNYTLNPGAQVVITISGKVVQPPSSTITNTATMQALQNKVSITRTASVTTIVRPGIDLTVTNYATCTPMAPAAAAAPSLLPCPPFRARSQFDYLITVSNSGLNDASGVVVRVPLPNDVIFEGYDNLAPSGGFTCSVDATNTVLCVGGTVPGELSSGQYPGTSRQLRLHLTAPNATGSISATTTVDPYNAIAESDETNNTFRTTMQIDTGVDLVVSQTVRCPRDARPMCDPAAASGTLIYDVLVQSVGTQDTGAVKLTDILPAGAQFRSAKEVPNVFGSPYTPPHGVSCAATGTQVDCTGGRLKGIYAAYGAAPLAGHTTGTPDNLTIEITAFAPAPYGPNGSPTATGSPILNQVRVDPDGTIPEFNESNNLNVLETNVGIPPTPGDWGTFNELTISNTQSNPASGPVAPNGTLDYKLTVSNWGSDPVSNVTVYDYVPQGARFRNAAADALSNGSGGFACSFASGLVTCSNGALAASPGVNQASSTTITIRLFAPETVNAATTQYTNHAVVDPNNTVPEANETNNVSDVSLTVAPMASSPAGQNPFNELTVQNKQTKPSTGAVAPNGTLEYTLTVSNSGSDPVSNVAVTDSIPQGARFRNVTADPLAAGNGGFVCSFNAGVVSCASGSLAGGGSTSIRILLFAPPTANDATTQYTNHAVVDPNNAIPEADENNNVSDIPLTVALPPTGQNAYNELTVENQQSNPASGAVAPNGTLEYKLNVRNSGSDPVNNVTVYDYIPTTARFRDVKADPLSGGNGGFVCSFNAGLVSCTKGSLAGGGSTQITILLFAPNSPDDATTHYTNHAVVDPDSTIPEANENNNVADTPLTVALPPAGQNAYNDLIVSNDQAIPASAAAVAPSGTLIYRLAVGNAGSDPATNVVVRDYLPAGTTFRSAKYNAILSTSSTPFTCSQTGGIIECGNGSVGSGGAAVIDVTLFAPAQPGTINNQAAVDPDGKIPEANESNNTAVSADTTVALGGAEKFIELSVGKLDAAPTPVGTDTPVTYTLTIKNDGSDQAFNVKVTDKLPQGAAFVSADDAAPNTPGAFACAEAGGLVTCSGGSIPGGGSRDITIIAKSPKQSDVTLVNNQVTMNDSAQVDPDNAIPEGDETNNGASKTITVLARVDLAVSNDGSNCATNPSNPGGCTWSFGVTNNGPDAVSNVVVRTDLPAGVTPLDVQAPNGWACQITINPVNQITCSNGGATLVGTSPGNSAQFNIHVHVSANNGDSLRGSTVVDPDNTIVETNEANNTASGTITIQANVDLSVTNDGSGCQAMSAAECNWLVTVSNAGTAAVSGVVVRTDFPVGVIPLDVAQIPGWTCQITENPINQVTCTTGSGLLAAGTTANFSLHVYVTANQGSTISSSSIVDPDNTVVETDESNNTFSTSVQA